MPAPIVSLDQLAPLLPGSGALIGLDLGTRTIGLAISDPARRMVVPVETIRREKFTLDAERLLAVAATRGAVGLVLGLPLNMDGSEGPRAQSTRAFARNLSRLTDLPIGLWDERLSTVEAEERLRAAALAHRKRREMIDQAAAVVILETALARLAT